MAIGCILLVEGTKIAAQDGTLLTFQDPEISENQQQSQAA